MDFPDTDELSRQLRAWKVEPRVPPGFQREVWRRIADRSEDALRPGWLGELFSPFARPRPALTLVAVMLLGGVGLAHRQAESSNARNWKALEARYADSVNPLAMMAR